MPNQWDINDAQKFLETCNKVNFRFKVPFRDINNKLLSIFSYVCFGQICPLNSFIGGVVAQEIMKGCTKKFHPIVQFLYFDCRECLPQITEFESEFEKFLMNENLDVNNRYISQMKIFGKNFQKKLANSRYFLVGAGALGCEFLKNFAIIGLGCDEKGSVTVTDMETIENHNLNRQFLFREKDIKSYKAIVAANAVKKMNPSFNIISHTIRVGKETEDTFDDDFFQSLDGICNALDNVESRIYMEKKCIFYSKPLIESGTQGVQGSTMPILPFKTESYSSIASAPDTGIPMCTLRYFPTNIIHTIEWARDIFEGEFKNSIEEVMSYIREPLAYIERVKHLTNRQKHIQDLYQLMVDNKPKDFSDCIKWARNKFQNDYHNSIRDLLESFPPDNKDEDGQPFWTSLKKCPQPLEFNYENEEHINYILSLANLRAEVFNISASRDRLKIIELVKLVNIEPYKRNENSKININNTNSDSGPPNEEFEKMLDKLETSEINLKMTPIEFEKDDDTNLHIDLIMTCSNLRAESYGIEKADRFKTKQIAGRIIPAISTTTSAIVGLDCIELLKVYYIFDSINI